LAKTVREKAEIDQEVTEFEVSVGAVETFLTALAADQAVTAAQSNVERMEIFKETVEVLVNADLRPGSDSSHAQVELVRARNELIAAKRLAREQRLALGRWVALPDIEVEIAAKSLLSDPPDDLVARDTPNQHPLIAAQKVNISVIQARRESIVKEYRPKFEVLSTAFGRGTGALIDGSFRGGAHGLVPTTGNWALGLSISFPVFDYKQNQVRREIEFHREEVEAAHLDEISERLKSEEAQGWVDVDAAREIASNTPDELTAAQLLEEQAQARYKTGLGTVLEVADARRLVRQAETNVVLARIGIWKALFEVGAARGEIDDLLEAASR
jgi:outer membrane protein TolC